LPSPRRAVREYNIDEFTFEVVAEPPRRFLAAWPFTMTQRLTAIIQSEGDGFVALCPELDIASQGESIETARDNLCEALGLFFECAPPEEVSQRRINRG
jgi:predicted RNase H-like HicB family nuclease